MATLTKTAARQKSLSDVNKAYIAIAIALSAASFALVFMRLALDAGIPSPLVATGRLVIASIALTPIILRRYRSQVRNLDRVDILLAAFAGMWMAIHFLLNAAALLYAKVAIAQVIINTTPLWVAVLETFFLKTKLPRLVWIGLIVAMFGGFLIGMSSTLQPEEFVPETLATLEAAVTGTATEADRAMFGNLLALGGSLAGAFFLTIGRKVRAKVANVPYVWMMFSFAAITGSFFMLFTGVSVTGHSWEGYFWVVMVGLVPQLIGHSGFNYALAYLPATQVSLTAQAVSITTAIIAFLIFAEIPSGLEILGSVIIGIGVVLSIWSQRKPRKVKAG